jgi:hypothetical protein
LGQGFLLSAHYTLIPLLAVVGPMIYPLHIYVSNQSLEIPVILIEIQLDVNQIFNKQMTTGTQHNWEEIKDLPNISNGTHTLRVHEAITNITNSEEITVDRELWIVVMYNGPEKGIGIEVFDHPIGFI